MTQLELIAMGDKNKVTDLEAETTEQEFCVHCQQADQEQGNENSQLYETIKEISLNLGNEDFESPFLAVRPVLRFYQVLGVFNVSANAACTSFECRPLRLGYSLALNVALVAAATAAGAAWSCAARTTTSRSRTASGRWRR